MRLKGTRGLAGDVTPSPMPLAKPHRPAVGRDLNLTYEDVAEKLNYRPGVFTVAWRVTSKASKTVALGVSVRGALPNLTRSASAMSGGPAISV